LYHRDLHSFPTRALPISVCWALGPIWRWTNSSLKANCLKEAERKSTDIGNLFRVMRLGSELLSLSRAVTAGQTGLLGKAAMVSRSEEHTSELQSRENLVC